MTTDMDLGAAYLGLFGRTADAPGFAYWKASLDAGNIDLATLIKHFTNTREFADRTEFAESDAAFIAEAYTLILGRTADAAGQSFYEGLLANGLGRETVLEDLLTSAEFMSNIGNDVVVVPALADLPEVQFNYGIASGDPYAESVVLWTHAENMVTGGDVALTWQVSTDANFTTVVASGSVIAEEENDNTAQVIADGLTEGTEYFYRFVSETGETTETGRTKTLDVGNVDQISFAVFSCTNYPAGFFNAYAEAVDRGGYDALVYLGDYIYEYGAGGYATDEADALLRSPLPTTDIVTVEDYSARYKQYHSDTDLQDLRASAPMIAIWDDHETANDSWETGAQNHDPATQGDWFDRRDAALEAYYNWMPIRTPESGDLTEAYRSFDFGDLVSLHILETRLVARDETRADLGSALTERLTTYATEADFATLLADLAAVGPLVLPEGVDPLSQEAIALVTSDQTQTINLAVTALLVEANDPDRDLLGETQLAWLESEIDTSNATWQVLGQQVLMNRMELPAALLTDTSGALVPQFLEILQKQALGQELTAEEAALVANKLPYNLDAWDGYVAEREAVLDLLAGENFVALAGDTHNAWNGDIRNASGDKVGEIFATPGVTSPGLEAVFAQLPPSVVASLFTGYVDGLDFANTENRGFLEITFTEDAATGSFVFVDTVGSANYDTFVETQTYSIA